MASTSDITAATKKAASSKKKTTKKTKSAAAKKAEKAKKAYKEAIKLEYGNLATVKVAWATKKKKYKTATVKTKWAKKAMSLKKQKATQCRFGKKLKWGVAKSYIRMANDLTYTIPYDADKSKKKKRTVSLPYTIYRQLGVDIPTEINKLNSLTGKKNKLYIGTKIKLTCKLTNVAVSNLKVLESGKPVYGTVTLTFTEVKKSSKKKK